jgi:transcriptional antiterminator RfaH
VATLISHRDALWYAFVTKPRHEKKAKTYLDGAGLESYLPLQKSLSQWSDRKKWVEKPLFSSYIFCHIPFRNRFDVLQQPGMVRIVGFNNEAMPVQNSEIEAIKLLLSTDFTIKVRNGFVPGEDIRISSGLLMGYEGKFLEERGEKYFVIHIATIGKSVLVDSRHVKIERI